MKAIDQPYVVKGKRQWGGVKTASVKTCFVVRSKPFTFVAGKS